MKQYKDSDLVPLSTTLTGAFKLASEYGGISGPVCETHAPKVAPNIMRIVGKVPCSDECEHCRAERKGRVHAAQVALWMLSPDYSHTRTHNGQHVTIYHRNSKSPSGVLSVGGTSVQMLRELQMEGLIPTSRNYTGEEYMFRTAATANKR